MRYYAWCAAPETGGNARVLRPARLSDRQIGAADALVQTFLEHSDNFHGSGSPSFLHQSAYQARKSPYCDWA